jgi:hypothetical protein
MDMRRTVVVVLVALLTLLAAAWPAWAQPEQARAGQEAQVDFNGDGFDDLAVGAPGEAIGSLDGAGAVNVLYGSAAGLVASPEVFIQASNGVGGTAEQNDTFGRAIAQGLFNDDEFFDLAVGSPGEAAAGPARAARSTSSTAPPAPHRRPAALPGEPGDAGPLRGVAGGR